MYVYIYIYIYILYIFIFIECYVLLRLHRTLCHQFTGEISNEATVQL